MVGLIDLVPATEQVAGVTVYGVSARGIATLLARFPELRKLMSGVAVDAEQLIGIAPDAVAAIISCGIGKPGDKDTEEIIDRLPVETQADFLAAIMRLTMPQGVGPFVEKLSSLGGILSQNSPVGESSGKAQGTKSPKASKA